MDPYFLLIYIAYSDDDSDEESDFSDEEADSEKWHSDEDSNDELDCNEQSNEELGNINTTESADSNLHVRMESECLNDDIGKS